MNYAGNEAAAGETLAAVVSAGGNAVLSRFDVGNAAEVDAAVKAIVAERGRIDILVNNAGVTRDNLLMRLTEDDFDAVVRTNLKGTFLVTKVVSRQMIRQRGGRIVNMSSVVGEMGNAGQSVYAATKAGILGFTKAMARELASRQITAPVRWEESVVAMRAAGADAFLEVGPGKVLSGLLRRIETDAATAGFCGPADLGAARGLTA